MRSILSACPAVLLAALGCGPTTAPAPRATATAATAPAGPVVLNADYANWSRYNVGTTVKRQAVTTVGAETMTTVETFRLAELTDREVVIERRNVTERSNGTYKQDNTDTLRFHKSFELPAGMAAEDFQKPDLKAKQTGEEAITAAGREYKAKVYKWTAATDAGPMEVVLWSADDMPGRIVKQTMSVAKTKSDTVEQVTEVQVK